METVAATKFSGLKIIKRYNGHKIYAGYNYNSEPNAELIKIQYLALTQN